MAEAPRLRCHSDLRLRLQEVLRGYVHQLTVGCGSPDCASPHCAGRPGFVPPDTPASVFDAARTLARDAFRVPTPVYHFCRHLPFPVDVLHLDVVDRSDLAHHGALGSAALAARVRAAFRPEPLCHSFLQAAGPPATETDSGIDTESLTAAYALIAAADEEVQRSLRAALRAVAEAAEAAYKAGPQPAPLQLRPLLIVLLWPGLADPAEHQILAPALRALCALSPSRRRVVAHWLARLTTEEFRHLVMHVVQSFITLTLLTAAFVEPIVGNAAVALGILYDANTVDGGEDKIDYKDFYNDAVNSVLDLREDHARWYSAKCRGLSGEDWEHFSFTQFPFLLDPGAKAAILGFTASRQQSEVQGAAISSVLFGGLQVPLNLPEFLVCVLRIDRQHLVQSALQQVTLRLGDLKKPLKIVFLGEDGIDEGGVRKEFFQLLTARLFDPQCGMFQYSEASRLHWFNPNSFENMQEFRLIGIMFGLAIYNSVILEIRFPLAIYKKMLGLPVGLGDLRQLDPELHKGLCDLLTYPDPDAIEETYGRTFAVQAEVYGAQMLIPLKPGGETIPLTKDNREEYVRLYASYLLEDSIRKQYDAFNGGFREVCSADMLQMFRPEELELLVCGSPELDFQGLERECRYDGFTKDSPTVRNFWAVVHGMDEAEGKRLLRFCTGSDRVPIRGLASLPFVLARNGDDSDMLPTAHTCFNHLLLPDYATKEKLKAKLLLAMNNCTGFGLR